jgi:hypothetical protein
VLEAQGDLYQIAEYYSLHKRGISHLRSRLDRLFHGGGRVVTDSPAHLLLSQLRAPVIYTTNWDHWIEEAFTNTHVAVHVVRGIMDLADVRGDVAQLVKFHGDLEGPEADFVFTETSYLSRLAFESPLDYKLLSDILGKTVLFIGYSFTDINLRFIWQKMRSMIRLLPEDFRAGYPRSYIVAARPNPLQQKLFEHRYIDVIELPSLDPSAGVVQLLQDLVAAATP